MIRDKAHSTASGVNNLLPCVCVCPCISWGIPNSCIPCSYSSATRRMTLRVPSRFHLRPTDEPVSPFRASQKRSADEDGTYLKVLSIHVHLPAFQVYHMTDQSLRLPLTWYKLRWLLRILPILSRTASRYRVDPARAIIVPQHGNDGPDVCGRCERRGFAVIVRIHYTLATPYLILEKTCSMVYGETREPDKAGLRRTYKVRSGL